MELINERKELYSDLIHKVLSGAKLNTFLSYTVDKSVILRHDVDNSIDDAVIMAEFEKKMGIKSTYFILHTAKYFNYSEKLIENCVAIQNYGHDIGFHNNSITLNVKRKIPIEKAINKPLNFLRKNGLVVRGTSAHGVPDCYKMGYYNYEIWKEFDPKKVEGRKSHKLIPKGKYFLKHFGFEYDADFVKYEFYLDDSGGGWNSMIGRPKLFGKSLKKNKLNRGIKILDDWNNTKDGIFQILTHPCYWKIG